MPWKEADLAQLTIDYSKLNLIDQRLYLEVIHVLGYIKVEGSFTDDGTVAV